MWGQGGDGITCFRMSDLVWACQSGEHMPDKRDPYLPCMLQANTLLPYLPPSCVGMWRRWCVC